MKRFSLIAAAALAIIAVASCTKTASTTVVKTTIELPEEITINSVSDITLSFTNVSTGIANEYSFETVDEISEDANDVTLYEGLYDISFSAKVNYAVTDETADSTLTADAMLRAGAKQLSIVGASMSLNLEAYLSSAAEGFVISEIFLAGTVTPEGKQYSYDAYFRITNNSDEVLYADRLFLAESQFMQASQYDYTPDIRSSAVACDYVTVLPGDGDDYPVQPGETILIANNALNHAEEDRNPNSFDLSGADFECYDVSSNENFLDTDNENVPNAEHYYKSSLTIWTPHMRGYKSYIIGYMPEDITAESFATDYYYAYTYEFVYGEYSRTMNGDAVYVPNSWISDAVNMAILDQFVWNIIDPSLDSGYAYCRIAMDDAEAYGKAVRRKYDSSTGKLVDTNDSSADFDSRVTADPTYEWN